MKDTSLFQGIKRIGTAPCFQFDDNLCGYWNVFLYKDGGFIHISVIAKKSRESNVKLYERGLTELNSYATDNWLKKGKNL